MLGALVLIVRLGLAATFLVAGAAKLLDPKGTRRMLGEFGVPPRLAPAAALLLPAVELAAAALLVPSPTARAGALLSLALIAVFVAVVARSLSLVRLERATSS